MKLTKGEITKLNSEGITTLVALTLLLFAILGTSYYFINKEVSNQDQSLEANKNLLSTNRRDSKEIKFLRENQRSIESMWSTLKNWGTGITAYDLEPFDQVGIIEKTPIPPAKIPSNPIEYAGMKITGTKTEFQRIVSALTDTENAAGLLQVKSCVIQIPNSTLPYSTRPTYLESQMEIVGPISQ
jgi:hypothetical protein